MTPHTNRLTRISDSSSSSTSSTSVPTLPTPTTTSSSSSYVPDFKPDFRLLTLPRTDHTTNYILNDPAHHQFTYHTPPPLSNYVHLITNNNNNNSNLRSTPPGLASPSVQFFDQLHYNGMNSHLMNIPSSSSSSSTTTTTSSASFSLLLFLIKYVTQTVYRLRTNIYFPKCPCTFPLFPKTAPGFSWEREMPLSFGFSLLVSYNNRQRFGSTASNSNRLNDTET